MSSSVPTRSGDQLTPPDRQRLEEAHRRLRDAVAAYEPFIGRELVPGEQVPVHDATQMARAQAEVEKAEQELWRLREELLGWTRPAWAPEATLVADWFSEEDRSYDEATAEPGR